MNASISSKRSNSGNSATFRDCLPLSLSVCLSDSVCLPACLFLCLSVYLPAPVPQYLSSPVCVCDITIHSAVCWPFLHFQFFLCRLVDESFPQVFFLTNQSCVNRASFAASFLGRLGFCFSLLRPGTSCSQIPLGLTGQSLSRKYSFA